MIEIGYLLIFWIVACIFIIFKSIKIEEIRVESEIIHKLINFSSPFIKGVPAILAALFVLIMRSSDSLFFFVLIGAFLFCFAGDLGMEKGILVGLPLFLIAQLLFSIAFLGQAFSIGISFETLIPTAVVIGVVVGYMFMFLRYLDSSETGLGEFKIPVIMYCLVISTMLISSFLLWITLGILEVIVMILGAIIFVISDSIIGIHEFHHKISRNVLKVMGTYYMAIFLLSLGVLLI
ncbi:MAG: lysoplasmalogenase family protein [Promethearchaeota archaeon]